MKNLFTLLLLFVSAITLNAEIVSGSCGDDVTYTLNTETGVLKIEGTGEMTNYSRDSERWSSHKSCVKEVLIANGVTSIGVRAFWDCPSLTSITIPSSVTSIGDYAFWLCRSLSSITISEGVTSIGNSAFRNCSSLSSITIPKSVSSIESSAFSSCI